MNPPEAADIVVNTLFFIVIPIAVDEDLVYITPPLLLADT
jgi:hypothetical protein